MAFATSNNLLDAHRLLDEARQAGRRKAQLVSGVLVGFGLLLGLPGYVCVFLGFVSVTMRQKLGGWVVVASALAPVGLFTLMLAVTPAMPRAIRGGAQLMQCVTLSAVPVGLVLIIARCDHGAFACSTSLLMGISSLLLLPFLIVQLERRILLRRGSGRRLFVCSFFTASGRAIMRRQFADFGTVHGTGARWMVLLSLFGLFPAFWLEGHPGYYAVPARAALDHFWRTVRVMVFLVGLALGVAAVLLAVDGQTNWSDLAAPHQEGIAATPSTFASLSLSCIFCVLFSTPINRRRIHAALGRLASTPEEQRAAAVAALIGRVDVAKVDADNFRVLPFNCLSQEHFSSSGDSGLHTQTLPAALGDCDAFIS